MRCVCCSLVSQCTIAWAECFSFVTVRLSDRPACNLEHRQNCSGLSVLVYLDMSWHTEPHHLSGRGGCLRPFKYPNSNGPVWLRFPTIDVFWPKSHVNLSALFFGISWIFRGCFIFKELPVRRKKTNVKLGYTPMCFVVFLVFFFNKYLRKIFK